MKTERLNLSIHLGGEGKIITTGEAKIKDNDLNNLAPINFKKLGETDKLQETTDIWVSRKEKTLFAIFAMGTDEKFLHQREAWHPTFLKANPTKFL